MNLNEVWDKIAPLFFSITVACFMHFLLLPRIHNIVVNLSVFLVFTFLCYYSQFSIYTPYIVMAMIIVYSTNFRPWLYSLFLSILVLTSGYFLELILLAVYQFWKSPIDLPIVFLDIARFLILALVAFFLKKQDYVALMNSGKKKYQLYFFIPLCVILFSLDVIVIFLTASEEHILTLQIGLTLLIIFLTVLFCYHKIFLLIQEDKIKEEALAGMKVQRLYDYELSSFRHDYKNFTTFLLEALKSGETELAVDKLRETENKVDHLMNAIDVGDSLLSGFLNQKIGEAKQRGIRFLFQHELLDTWTIDLLDLSLILGIIIDNAMEAVEKLSEEERSIYLQLRTEKNVVSITTLNTLNGKVIFNKEHLPISNKLEKHHGYGIRNAAKIADKYGGAISASQNGNLFKVCIILFQQNLQYINLEGGGHYHEKASQDH